MSHEAMMKAVQRHENARMEPKVEGYEGESFDALLDCMNRAAGQKDRKVTFRRGRDEDGMPQLWWKVSVGGEVMGVGNVSFNCPPWPPEYCDE